MWLCLLIKTQIHCVICFMTLSPTLIPYRIDNHTRLFLCSGYCTKLRLHVVRMLKMSHFLIYPPQLWLCALIKHQIHRVICCLTLPPTPIPYRNQSPWALHLAVEARRAIPEHVLLPDISTVAVALCANQKSKSIVSSVS